jgi:PqqD family protein of HPr-rel-A system
VDKLSDLAISDSGFVFDPWSGATFSLNGSGLAVLRLLKEGLRGDALLEALDEQFDVREGDLRREVDEFLGQLQRHELLADEEA